METRLLGTLPDPTFSLLHRRLSHLGFAMTGDNDAPLISPAA